MRLERTILTVALFSLFLSVRPRAEDNGQYENVSPEIRQWYKSLKQPTAPHSSCCDISDCGPVDFQTSSEGFQAMLYGKWIDIPVDKVVHTQGNPVGQAVLCYNKPSVEQYKMDLIIYCFVPGALI